VNQTILQIKYLKNQRREFAFACAIIAKELDVNIPDV
jgi:hypothetical protein